MLKNLSSKPLNGIKNNANGAPKKPKINEPHIGQPAPNTPKDNPAIPNIFVLKPDFLIFLILYINKVIYNPKRREITIKLKKVRIV